MKVAVLVYGEYREFDNVVDSWKIFQNLDVDYYFSTWNESNQISSKLGISKKISVNEEMIKTHLPNSIIDIQNESKVIESNIQLVTHNSYKIYFHWKNLLKILNEVNKEYDVMILMRPDLYLMWPYHSEMTFPMHIDTNVLDILKNDDKIYAVISEKDCVVNDTFLIGSAKLIKKLLSEVDSFETNIHTELWKYFQKNKIETLNHQYFVLAFLVRFNTFLDKEKEFFKFEKIDKTYKKILIRDYIAEKFLEWGSISALKPYLWVSPEARQSEYK